MKMTQLSFLTLVVFAVSCSHSSKKGNLNSENTSSNNTVSGFSSEYEEKIIHDLPGPQATVSTDMGQIPVEVNGEVEKWIQYFQGRGRAHFERYLERSARYTPLMKKILRDNGVPEDLIYICMIESGFSSKIKSKAKAVGFWQFIKGTGDHYGLRSNKLLDERYDPVRSTEAAAAYFKGLYNLFNSWFLAIASYNVGENRIKSLVMKNYTRDFWEIARRGQLPAETTQYIPKFLAAGLIAREPEKYGFTGLDYHTPMVFDSITAKETIDMRMLAKAMKVSYEELQLLNPAYKTQYAPVLDGEAYVRVPQGTKEIATQAVEVSLVRGKRFLAEADDTPPHKNSYLKYKVQRGETLEKIAERFDVTVDAIAKINRVRKKRLRPGTTLKIPQSNASGQSSKKDQRQVNRGKINIPKESILHIVKKGETLTRIASKHKISVATLAKANGISPQDALLYGQKISIPK